MSKGTIALTSFLVAASLYSASGQSEEAYARAVASGPENRMYEFHQHLLATLGAFLGTNDPNSLMVVCDILDRQPVEATDCGKLKKDGEALTKVQYTFIRDHARLEAFVLSWALVQTSGQDELVTLKFDISLPTMDCASLGGPNCYYNGACAGPPRRCDMKPVGPPCSPCPPQ